jgi:DNA invertase Pin-like site-specific DNA recombinase
MPKPGRPHSGKWIAYYRVSTDRQGDSGLGLDAQRKLVSDYLNGGNWTLAAEFTEVESGKRSDRPQLAAALTMCKRLRAKLVVAKLDRLSRNVGFISALMDSGVEFVAADMPHANKMTLQVMAVFAEYERDQISERTRRALAQAKERGTKLGGPKRLEASALGAAANRSNAERFAANTLPIIREIQASGVTTLRGVARALNARGVPSARGVPWSPVAVINILKRATKAVAPSSQKKRAERPARSKTQGGGSSRVACRSPKNRDEPGSAASAANDDMAGTCASLR